MQSIELSKDPAVQYLLRLGDTCLVLSQRLSEWCGHGPVLEEDIALANMALDLLGQARGVLTRAGRVEGRGHDEDQLAYLRDERDYMNATIAELPRGDFAFTVLRNAIMATWLELMWQRLQASGDAELAAVAAKAVKEARYHRQHAADWVVRLGDGTDESAARLRAACDALWPYTRELFDADEVDEHAAGSGLGPAWSELQEPWMAQMRALFTDAGLDLPAEPKFRSDGKRGRHSEHMGFVLADLQYLQRAYPGGTW
jgi:ring-1,2-phenylacetyl-CoA epoxidase subunit PaaC